MLFEQIYGYIMLFVMIIFVVGLNMIYDHERGFFGIGDYGNKVKAIGIYKWVLGIVFVIVNLISMFASFQYLLSAAVTLVFNIYSFGFLLYDTLFVQVKTERYILALQDSLLKEVPIVDMFEYGENIAKYDLSGNDNTMLFKVIQGENGFLLGKQGENKNELLIPKEKLEEAEIRFFCEQINIYWTQQHTIPEFIKVFEDKSLYNHRKEFVWVPAPKIKFLYSEAFRKRFFKFLKILFYVLVFVLVIFCILDYFEILTLDTITQWFAN